MLFCIIFAAFWVGMIGIGAAAFSSGDPNLLYYGFDSSGYLCGGGGREHLASPLPLCHQLAVYGACFVSCNLRTY